MRYFLLIFAVSLLSLQVGFLLPREDSHKALDKASASDGEQICLAQDAQQQPVSINDQAMKQRASHAGGALVENGAATPLAALIKQLNLERCELSLASDTSLAASNESLYDYAKQSIVVISAIYKCDRCDHWHAGCASGFVIAEGGVIATNYHVVDQPEKSGLVAMTHDGRMLPVTRVLAANEANDIAILQVEAEGLKPLPITKDAAVGTPIALISHPDSHFYTYTAGVVSRYTQVRHNKKDITAMTITADFARGSSGAPVLNMQGEVVGIVRSTESVYYTEENGQQQNLQMVFKTCVPSARLLDLIVDSPVGQ